MMHFTNPQSRVPKWWERLLRTMYEPPKTFTTRQAVRLYIDNRLRPQPSTTNDTYWVEMNARNALSCLVQLGELKRVRRGVYRFK